jgi:hypothetical protein
LIDNNAAHPSRSNPAAVAVGARTPSSRLWLRPSTQGTSRDCLPGRVQRSGAARDRNPDSDGTRRAGPCLQTRRGSSHRSRRYPQHTSLRTR